MCENTRKDIREVAENFCKTYFNCWEKAMESEEGQYKYRGKKYDDVGLLKAWTDFHMKNILYKLAEELSYFHKEEGNKKYKTHSCQDLDCANCKKEKGDCGYGTSWQQEYYKVDLLLCEHQGAGNWCNDFYIEHENAHFKLKKDDVGNVQVHNMYGWFDEFNKLLPLKTSENGMRVIIAYDDFDMVEEKKQYLLDKQLNNKDNLIHKSIVECPILVILAPSNKAINNDKHYFELMLFSVEN
ncbi:MAG: hypothetical protein K2M36_04100, partial [Clostridia bacterium]|nr:hypothetical protein [Clostridia bacterium]